MLCLGNQKYIYFGVLVEAKFRTKRLKLNDICLIKNFEFSTAISEISFHGTLVASSVVYQGEPERQMHT